MGNPAQGSTLNRFLQEVGGAAVQVVPLGETNALQSGCYSAVKEFGIASRKGHWKFKNEDAELLGFLFCGNPHQSNIVARSIGRLLLIALTVTVPSGTDRLARRVHRTSIAACAE